MELQWSPDALADRDSIYSYIEKHNPAAASAMDALFMEKAVMLTRFPYGGKEGRAEGTRELVAHRSYILVYEIDGNRVRILNVVHAARQWPPQPRRA